MLLAVSRCPANRGEARTGKLRRNLGERVEFGLARVQKVVIVGLDRVLPGNPVGADVVDDALVPVDASHFVDQAGG